MVSKLTGKGKKKKDNHPVGNKTGKKTNIKTSRQRREQRHTGLIKGLNDYSPAVLFFLLAPVLLISPFYRGLFFTRELLYAQAFVFVLLALWGCFRFLIRENLQVRTPLDLCLLALLLAYGISFFFAVHKRDALEEFLKIAAYLVIYLLVFDICRFLNLRRLFPRALSPERGSESPVSSAASPVKSKRETSTVTAPQEDPIVTSSQGGAAESILQSAKTAPASKGVSPAKSAQAAPSAQAAQSAQVAKPTQTAQSAQVAKPTQTAQSAQVAKQAQAAQSAQAAPSAQVAPSAQAAPSAQVAKPTQAAQSAQPIPSDLPPGLPVMMHFLLFVSLVITLASLGVAAGHWDFIGAYADNRLASPMGYANAAAAFFMATYLMTIALAPTSADKYRLFYLASAVMMLIAFILTFSRGGWLLLPPTALLLIIAVVPAQRMRILLYLIITGLVGVPAAFIADPLFRSAFSAQGWIPVVAAIALVVLCGILAERFLAATRKTRLILAGSAVLVVIVLFAVTLIGPAFAPIGLTVPPDEDERLMTLEQVITDVAPAETYHLTMEVEASGPTDPATAQAQEPLSAQGEETGEVYAWGVTVLGGVPGYRDDVLFEYRGGATAGPETREFSFTTPQELTRLSVQLHSRYPGSSFTVRDVTLSAPGKEHNLRFTLHRVLPERVYDRVFSYSRDENVDRRFELFRDAFKVIADYPVFGVGGGGWASVYQAYQEQPYFSREVHNHFLQVWIEAGVIGFLAFIGIWIAFAAAFIRNSANRAGERVAPQVRQYWAAAFIPVAALGAHSLIDWNFSMAAVGFFLFALLGAGRSLDGASWFRGKKGGDFQTEGVKSGTRAEGVKSGTRADGSKSGNLAEDIHYGGRTAGAKSGNLAESINVGGRTAGVNYLTGIFAFIIGLALALYSLALIGGYRSTALSQELLDIGNVRQATVELQRAIRLDPLEAANYHNLGVILEERMQRTGERALEADVLGLAHRAYQLESHNPSYFLRFGTLLLNYVDFEEGLALIDKIIVRRPFSATSYLEYAMPRLRLAAFHLEMGYRAEAERFLSEVIVLEPLMEERVGSAEILFFALGRSHFLLGDHRRAEEYFRAVPPGDMFYHDALEHLAEIRGELIDPADENASEEDPADENGERNGEAGEADENTEDQ